MEKKASVAGRDPKNWVTLYGDQLFRYALPRVGDRGIAEDLVQDTFLSALKGLSTLENSGSEKGWLFAILKNKIIDHYRKKSSDIVSLEEMTGADTRPWFEEDGKWIVKKRPKNWSEPENLAEQKELQRIVDHCKERLKEFPKQVFILKYLEDMDTENICKVLNISPSNYWVLIHRARLQVRECIEHTWLKR